VHRFNRPASRFLSKKRTRREVRSSLAERKRLLSLVNDTFQDLVNGAAGHHVFLDAMMKVAASDFIYLIPAVLLLLWFLPVRNRALNQRLAGATFLAAVGSLAIAFGVGHLFSEARPFVSDSSTRLLINHSADNAFPSDHAALAFGASGVLLWRRYALGLVMVLGALLVGFARIYVGVHWPSDILASAVIGLSAGGLLSLVVPALELPQRILARVLPGFLISSPEVTRA
jgi:undecaprenyl-diphosphatase